MVDNFKKRFFISAILGILGEVILILYLSNIYPAFNWQLIIGSLLLLTGFLIIFNIFPFKKTVFRDNHFLFYAIIFNPGLVSIFAGIIAITIRDPKLEYAYIPAGIAMIFSFFIGLIIFAAHFKKKIPKI